MAPFQAAPFRLLCLALTAVLAACASTKPTASSGASGQELRVVTTFLPITLFTRAVAGDCAEVTALIPPGTGPHDFQARPADLLALRRAQVLVKNGLGMESFLNKLVTSGARKDLTVIDASLGVATLATPPAAPKPPAADQGDALEHGHSHDHGHAHDHGPINPHIWLDPRRAMQQVQTIRDGLIRHDPRCAEGYRRNADAFISQLRQLDRDIAGRLHPFQGRSFVAFHDVAPYFAERYGLRGVFFVDVPELNPSPADLQRVAAAVKADRIRAVLREPQQANRSFEALARDLGVKVSVFDPLEIGSDEAARDPGTYIRVMRSNVAQLRHAFGR